ncbi:unnamed protein product, partial [Musa hybrid cultivar]
LSCYQDGNRVVWLVLFHLLLVFFYVSFQYKSSSSNLSRCAKALVFVAWRLPKHGSMSAIRFPPERKNGKLRLH